MTSLTIRQQAEHIFLESKQNVINPAYDYRQLQQTSKKIEALIQKIHSSAPNPENKEALAILIRARNITVVDPLRYIWRTNFNTIFPSEPPVIENTGFRGDQAPMICTYHQGGAPGSTSLGLYRLSPASIHLVPKKVLEAAGDLSGKQVDLLCQTLDTGNTFHPQYYNKRHPANLYTHHWTHHSVLQGQNAKGEYPMGLFPTWGLVCARGNTTHPQPHPLAFDALSNMVVHSHPRGNRMVYSPDYAHFFIDESSPFAVTWAVVKDKDERVLITRITMIHDRTDPITQAISDVSDSENCPNLDAHLEALSMLVPQAIQGVLAPSAAALKSGDLTLFDALPQWHQKNILKHAALIKGATGSKSSDFTPQQLQQAIQLHAQELTTILVDEPTELATSSVAIRSMHDRSSLQLIELAEKFENNDPSAMDEFSHLGSDQQKAVMYALWRLNGHPRSDNSFARKHFATCSNGERARAIRLAVTSKPFAYPQLPPTTKDVGIASSTSNSNDHSSRDSTAIEELIQRIEALKKHPSGPARVQKLHDLFDELKIDKSVKYAIYDEIGHKAGKVSQARNYGRAHFGDSLSAVQKGLRDFIETSKSPSSSSEAMHPTSARESVLVGKLQTIVEGITILQVLPSSEAQQQLHRLFDDLGIDKATVKYPLYDEIGRRAGKSSSERREYGRTHFSPNNTLQLLLEQKISSLLTTSGHGEETSSGTTSKVEPPKPKAPVRYPNFPVQSRAQSSIYSSSMPPTGATPTKVIPIGKDKGFQGQSNSCALSTILFTMFGTTTSFDWLLSDNDPRLEISTPQAKEIHAELKKIITLYRTRGYVPYATTHRLRELLAPGTASTHGKIDLEEAYTALFRHLAPRGLSSYQMFITDLAAPKRLIRDINRLPSTDVQSLLKRSEAEFPWSDEELDALNDEVLFLMPNPESNDGTCFKRIVPNKEITLTSETGKQIKLQLKSCVMIGDYDPTKKDDISISQGHFVTVTLDEKGDGYFFDSMADRIAIDYANGKNIPEVTPLPNFSDRLHSYSPSSTKTDALSKTDQYVRKCVSNLHSCVYRRIPS